MAKRKQKRAPKKPDPSQSESELLRQFLDRNPLYEKLCSEVAFSLEHELKSAGVEIAALTSRAKNINSLLEKIKRKSYLKPLEEITDLAGVRVVHLYRSDFPSIEKVLYEHFEVVQKVDKLETQDEDRFGYAATHFLVKLGDGFSGARYDELKTLICEVQVKTALQDAWAILSHHLLYKRESNIPKPLRRRINSLAGLIEVADDQFERIREDRDDYVKKLKEEVSDEDEFFAQDVNNDSVSVYLRQRFPDLPMERFSGHLNDFLSEFRVHEKYPTIADIDSVVQRTEKARELYKKAVGRGDDFFSSSGIVELSMFMDNPGMVSNSLSETFKSLIQQGAQLVDKT